MGETTETAKGSAPKTLARKQCPYCGFNNEYDLDAGAPAQCDACERKFADPMEQRAAYDAMLGRGFWFGFRRRLRGYWHGPLTRLVLIGVALGVVASEIARRIWA